MVYKFAPDENYEDLAGGRVLYHRGGMPSFPVRLGNEIFRRCLSYCGKKSGIRLYDPCCGGAYLLTVLGFFNGNAIEEIIGSDIDQTALALAKDNLSLLTPEGRTCRKKQLEDMHALYNKEAHKEALASLERLNTKAIGLHSPQISLFSANILDKDAFQKAALSAGSKADIIMTDVPYGDMTAWAEEGTAFGEDNYLNRLFDNLSPVRYENTITAVISNKEQKFNAGNGICRLDKINIGKRKVEIIRG